MKFVFQMEDSAYTSENSVKDYLETDSERESAASRCESEDNFTPSSANKPAPHGLAKFKALLIDEVSRRFDETLKKCPKVYEEELTNQALAGKNFEKFKSRKLQYFTAIY